MCPCLVYLPRDTACEGYCLSCSFTVDISACSRYLPSCLRFAETVADEEGRGFRKQKLSSVWDHSQTHQPHNDRQIIKLLPLLCSPTQRGHAVGHGETTC